MERLVITRTGPSSWSWSWKSDRGVEGTIRHHDDGTADWPDDPSGHAVTVAMILRLWPEPPDRITYETDTHGYQLDPEPPPRTPTTVRPPAPEVSRKLGERYGQRDR